MSASFRVLAFVTIVLVGCASSDKPAEPDPNRRLTRAECTAGVDHAIALFAADPAMADATKQLRDGRAGFIADCEATGKGHDHECLMAAKTSQALGLCPLPGKQ
jgi:hypothetical protein